MGICRCREVMETDTGDYKEMITLSREGQMYRYFQRYRMDRPTDLCQLTWKIFISMTILTLAGITCGFYVIGWFAIFMLPEHWTTRISMVGTFLGILFFVLFIGGFIFSLQPVEALGNIVAEGYRGFKDKYCPLVTWK